MLNDDDFTICARNFLMERRKMMLLYFLLDLKAFLNGFRLSSVQPAAAKGVLECWGEWAMERHVVQVFILKRLLLNFALLQGKASSVSSNILSTSLSLKAIILLLKNF